MPLRRLVPTALMVMFVCGWIHAPVASELEYPEYSKLISMDFKNASLTDVLKIFSQQSGLNFIAANNLADRSITLYLDNVPVETALEMVLSANDLTYTIQPGTDIFIVQAVTPMSQQLLTKVFRLQNATVDSSALKTTIEIPTDKDDEEDAAAALPSVGGQAKSGLTAAVEAVLSPSGRLVEDPRTNSLIVTDLASRFPAIEQTILSLDVPAIQILIEVEMLDVSKNTADLIGVKYGDSPLSLTGAKRATLIPFNQNDVLRKGFEFETEYTAGVIDASGFSALIQFLRTQSDTKNLARPRIMTLNNQRAQIKISTNEAIGITTETGASEGITTQSVEAERVQTGVFLTVTPQIISNSDEILMAVAPKVIQARAGATFENKTFKDAEERGTRSVLRVRDGETIVIGGLLRTDSQVTDTKIPILGDIPLIGSLFRHRDSQETERELLVFITPHILKGGNAPLSVRSERTKSDPLSRFQAMEDELSILEQQKF